MIASLLFLFQSIATPAVPADEGVVHRQSNSLEIPNEIASALVPYLECVFAATNAETVNAHISTGQAFLAAQSRAVAKCAATRASSRERSLAMLDSSSAPLSEREQFVERALSSVDHAQDGVAETLDRAKAK